MAIDLTPIETVYNGYRFRSRLEARWAVFFDTLGIEYEYEKEGYDLGDGLHYLPDFWLVQEKYWIEIKPDKPTEQQQELAYRLAKVTDNATVILSGYPTDKRDSYSFTYTGSVFLSRPHKGFFDLSKFWLIRMDELEKFLKSKGYEVPKGTSKDYFNRVISVDRQYYLDRYKEPHTGWNYGVHTSPAWMTFSHGLLTFDEDKSWEYPDSDLLAALRKAKSARFEHGDRG